MSAYYFNEGSFDSLDVGVVDSTIHILEFGDGSRLFVERSTAREGATAAALARDRSQTESRQRTGYRVRSETQRTFGDLEAFDVVAHYMLEADLCHQVRRHVVRGPSAFLFMMNAAAVAAPVLEARMNRLFDTLRFRVNGEGA